MRGDGGFPVRLRFAKQGRVRFVSHRDVARAFDRAFRIAELPLAFTQGFSPRPKVSFGPALALGYESQAEYLDVEFAAPVAVDGLPAIVADGLPEGVTVTGAVELAERAPALQEAITTLAYRVEVGGWEADELDEAVRAFLSRREVVVDTTRKGRPVTEDVRPAVQTVRATDLVLDIDIATRPRAARVGDVLSALRSARAGTTAPGDGRVTRTHQWIERGGARLEPLDADRRSSARVLGACA